MRLFVTDAAAQPPRQATAWLIMTLAMASHKPSEIDTLHKFEDGTESNQSDIAYEII